MKMGAEYWKEKAAQYALMCMLNSDRTDELEVENEKMKKLLKEKEKEKENDTWRGSHAPK